MNVAGARHRARGRRRRRRLRRRLGRAAQHHALAVARASTTRASARTRSTRSSRRTPSRSAALADGGVDLLLIETIFDTLNAKAAIAAAREVAPQLPLWISVDDRRPLGPHALRPDDRGVLDVDRARRAADRRRQLLARRDARCGRTSPTSRASRRAYVAAIRTPACRTRSAATTRRRTSPRRCCASSRRTGFLNIVGCCCGSTPEHTRAIAEAVRGLAPRALSPSGAAAPRFSGLEPFEIGPDTGFVLIGERTNVTGSARFRRLVEAGDFGGAVDVALEQVRGGANLLDVNMDADLLEGEQAMRTFLNVIATEPEVARLPIMVDSSKLVGARGRACSACRARAIVNSISLKEGEEEFLRAGAPRPRLRRGRRRDGVRRGGPGDRRRATRRDLRPRLRPARRARSASRPRTSSSTRTCSRSRPASRSTTTTRAPSSRACRGSRSAARARARPAASRTSASRSAATTASARRCTRRSSTTRSAPGSTWASSTPGQLAVYEDIEPELLERVEDVIFNRRPDATERLVELAERVTGEGTQPRARPRLARRSRSAKRLEHALVHGIVDFIEDDAEEARLRPPARST